MATLRRHLIIGIAGRAGAGKTTLAAALQFNLRQYPNVMIGYADVIKDLLCQIYGISLSTIHKSKEHPLGRWILEQVGSEYLHREIFTSTLRSRLIELPESSVVIVHDIRRRDEAELIHELGGIMLLLHRPVADAREPYPSEKQLHLLPFDIPAYNDKDNLLYLHKLSEDLTRQIIQHPRICTSLPLQEISKTEPTHKSV